MNKQKIKQPRKKKKKADPKPRKSDIFIAPLASVSKRPKIASITLGTRLLSMLSSCRDRDKKQGRETYITIDMLRELVLTVIGKQCPYCQAILDHKNISLDHIMPLARGGTSTIDNIQFTCKTCNTQKDKMLDNEFRALKNIIAEFTDDTRVYLNRKLSAQGGFRGFYKKNKSEGQS